MERRRSRRATVIAWWGLALVACREPVAEPAPDQAPAAPSSQRQDGEAAPALDPASLPGTIYFVSERDGDLEAYRWRAPATIERLTTDPRGDFVAEVDPLGSGWTRVSTRDGRSPEEHREQLSWVPAAGEPVDIGPEGRRARSPSWAPDRSFVVFESDADGAFSDLWRWNREGGTLTRLTRTEHGAFEPAVSPDGRSIAYVSTQDGNPELYLMAIDGAEPRRLTQWRRDDMAPRWSPDGGRLAFLRREQGGERLFVLTLGADGVQEARVGPEEPGAPLIHAEHAWSPDGRRLVFTEHRPGKPPRLMVADLGSDELRSVSPPSLRSTMPSWSPDGRYLAFAGTESDPEALDVYVVALDGGASVRLTSAPASDWLPRWVP